MNITSKIIITDTNIITDLNNANILREYVVINNVYISDMIKNDEINLKTGSVELIKELKVIRATPKQLIEVININTKERELSPHDILNYVLARDNNCILATGDNKLKNYSESNGVEVYRTLKIIKLMKDNKIISQRKALEACNLLKHNSTTRIPEESINAFINELEKDSITV